jgi:galactitol-specific phosphotransferase system IIB component
MQVDIMNLFYAMIIVISFYSNSYAQLASSEVETMSKNADVIITGKVTQQSASWNENKTRIYTQATIQVDEYLKGNSNGSSLVVIYPGGEVGDVGEMYSHMPRFENNEDVLVFLKKDDKSSNYKVFNGENGKISVISDPQTGEKVTTSNLKVNSLKTQIKSYIAE